MERSYFIGFYCPNQVTIDVTARFTSEEKALGKKKNQKVIVEDENKIAKQVSVYTEDEARALKRVTRSLQRSRSQAGGHIIHKNIKTAFRWNEIKHQQLQNIKQMLPKKV